MAKQMTKNAIVANLAAEVNLPKTKIHETLDAIAQLAYKEAKNAFTFPGIGKLVVVSRKARMGRNPSTGEAIKIPAKRVLKFRIAKACKEAAMGA